MKFLMLLLQGAWDAMKSGLKVGLATTGVALGLMMIGGTPFLPALIAAGAWGVGGAAVGATIKVVGLSKGIGSISSGDSSGAEDSNDTEVPQWDSTPKNKPDIGAVTVENDDDKADEEVEETVTASDVHKKLIDGEVKRESHAKRKKRIRDRPNKHKPSNM